MHALMVSFLSAYQADNQTLNKHFMSFMTRFHTGLPPANQKHRDDGQPNCTTSHNAFYVQPLHGEPR
jgi:hypothetical protein